MSNIKDQLSLRRWKFGVAYAKFTCAESLPQKSIGLEGVIRDERRQPVSSQDADHEHLTGVPLTAVWLPAP